MNAVRRTLRLVGAPARAVLIAAIRLYRMTLSGMMGGQCRFTPTCSRYGEEAIRTRGAIVGSGLATWRILRCNPYGKGGLDPVPSPTRRDGYEGDIPPVASAAAVDMSNVRV